VGGGGGPGEGGGGPGEGGGGPGEGGGGPGEGGGGGGVSRTQHLPPPLRALQIVPS